ncbi:MAG: hypothetical protein JW884_07605 [Deltaproteobacteria bacterium]|nr:hypothetical protein [Deltaproteobacteria bacterium]
MNASGLSPQRFSEFSHGIRNVTGEYFLKMIAGLALTPDDVEQISGKSFTDEQLLQIRFDSFVRSQRPFLEELMRDPLKLQAAKMAIRFERLWQRHIVKRFGKRLLKGRQS